MNIIIELHHAIQSLRPSSSCVIRNNDITQIDWSQDTSKEPIPTKEEILAEVKRLQAKQDKYRYTYDRANSYPSIQDQLDTLYHGGYDEWKAMITAIKEQFPKPE